MDNDGYTNDDSDFIGANDRANWAYGDVDSLGFNTLYVYLPTHSAPVATDEIWVGRNRNVVSIADGSTGHSFSGIELAGADDYLIESSANFEIVKSTLGHCDANAIQLGLSSVVNAKMNRFINSGHRCVVIGNDSSTSDRQIVFYNNYVFGTHLVFLNSDPTVTLNFIGNSSACLCFGFADFNNLSTTTYNIHHNQYSLDPVCHNGGTIALDGTSAWETTAVSDLPPGISTTAASGRGGVLTTGEIYTASPNTGAGTEAHTVNLTGSQTDIFGNTEDFEYNYNLNIGADLEKFGEVAPHIISGKIIGGRLVP